MKIKIVLFLLLGTFVLGACSKKQCPAYTQVEKESTSKAKV